MRVPNEKQVTCSRIEGEFPAGLDIYHFEFKAGWKIEFKKNDKGKIVRATWTGKMMPYEVVEFGMLGINPKEATDLVWKFVQYYDEWGRGAPAPHFSGRRKGSRAGARANIQTHARGRAGNSP
jgi:uncharacterized protein YcnI